MSVLKLATVLSVAGSALASELSALPGAEDVLSCAGTKIEVISRCAAGKDGAPPHCEQELRFGAKSATSARVRYQGSPTPFKDEPFAFRFSCMTGDRANFVVVRSTNFGNCSTCEWMDVFDTRGRLLGSTPSVVRALRLPPRKLSTRLAHQVEAAQESQFIEADRATSIR